MAGIITNFFLTNMKLTILPHLKSRQIGNVISLKVTTNVLLASMTKAESIHLINSNALTMKSVITSKKVGYSFFVANVVKLTCLFNYSKK